MSRRRIASAAFAIVIVAVTIVLHRPVVRWFTGKSPAIAVPTDAGAAHAYPPAAFDALRSAVDAYDRVRTALAADALAGVADPARTMSEALRAAGSAMEKDDADAASHAARAADAADRAAAAASLDDARKAFADASGELVAVVSADARLTRDWRLFECGMFEGHPRWMQRAGTPANPYMGTKMPACGVEEPWSTIDYWTCPMHPSVRQSGPGKCPICGMDLVAVTRGGQQEEVVTIDEPRRQLIGVRTAPVTRGPMRRVIRAVGRVSYDESALADVNLKVRGWITHLYVSRTGQRVAKGQRLFDMYSPELYNAQQDFLLASRGANEGLAHAARQRLLLLGMTDAQIDAVAKSGAPAQSVAFAAPSGGFVIEKNVVEGASVEPGMRLYRIAALAQVWVDADVYEHDLASVRVGQRADVTLDYLPGRAYEAKVSYVYPYLDAKARTGRIRIELVNAYLELRPGMYANVDLSADLGDRVQVPASAVVYTGPRRLVFVDLGAGRFRPQEIHVGTESNGTYEVLDGVRPGEIVATSGVFLIAAEARIHTAAKYWSDAP